MFRRPPQEAGEVEATDDSIRIDGDEIAALAERDPAKLPWRELGADIVVESTGIFTYFHHEIR